MTAARQALHGLGRNRGFAVAATASVALAVGANTAIFSLVNALWFRPSPLADPASLVVVYKPVVTSSDGDVLDVHQGVDLEALEQAGAFSSVTAELAATDRLADWQPVVRVEGSERALATAAVAHDYFQTLGVSVVGRPFERVDDIEGAEPVGIISHALWQTAFNGSSDVIGARMPTHRGPLTVVGIAPPDFAAAHLGQRYDLWIPLGALGRFNEIAAGGQLDRIMPITIIARLRDKRAFAEAEAQVHTIVDRRATLARLDDVRFRVRAAADVMAQGTLLRTLWAAAAMVLLLGCVNLAALLLARTESRRHEFAVRLCLGASTRDLVRLVAADALAVCVIGFAAGLVVRHWVIAALAAFRLPSGLTVSELNPGLDARVIAFAFVVAVIGTAVAAAGAVRLTARINGRPATAESTSTAAPQSLRARRFLLAAHVALAIVLLGAAAALLVNVRRAMSAPLGFDRDHLLFAEVRHRLSDYTIPISEPGSQLPIHYAELIQRSQSLPGIRSVSWGAPVFGGVDDSFVQGIWVDGRREELPLAIKRLGPGYLSTVGATFLEGRDLTPQDAARAVSPVDVLMARVKAIRDGTRYQPPSRVSLAVIDRMLAERLWPGRPAVGRFFVHERSGVRYEVAGVVASIVGHTAAPTAATLFEYQALEDDNGLGTLQFVARAGAAPDDQRAALLGVIRQVFPDPMRVDVRSTDALVAGERMQEIMGGRLFSWFGSAAALLGLAGIYGLVAFSILRQRRETGIRLVLGASSTSVRWRVIRQAMAPVIAGAAAGLSLTLALGEVVAALVAGAVRLDPMAYVAAATGFVAVALLAALAASRMPTSTHRVIELLRAD